MTYIQKYTYDFNAYQTSLMSPSSNF